MVGKRSSQYWPLFCFICYNWQRNIWCVTLTWFIQICDPALLYSLKWTCQDMLFALLKQMTWLTIVNSKIFCFDESLDMYMWQEERWIPILLKMYRWRDSFPSAPGTCDCQKMWILLGSTWQPCVRCSWASHDLILAYQCLQVIKLEASPMTERNKQRQLYSHSMPMVMPVEGNVKPRFLGHQVAAHEPSPIV